jgi:hypothetical protein
MGVKRQILTPEKFLVVVDEEKKDRINQIKSHQL